MCIFHSWVQTGSWIIYSWVKTDSWIILRDNQSWDYTGFQIIAGDYLGLVQTSCQIIQGQDFTGSHIIHGCRVQTGSRIIQGLVQSSSRIIYGLNYTSSHIILG